MDDKANFITEIIVDEHNRSGRFGGRVRTRFHLNPTVTCTSGTLKALTIDFGMAERYADDEPAL